MEISGACSILKVHGLPARGGAKNTVPVYRWATKQSFSCEAKEMRVAHKFRYLLFTLTGIFLLTAMTSTWAAKRGGGKGGGGDPAIIEITFSGSITGTMSCENKLNADSTILGCNKGGGFTFGAPILDHIQANGDCFQQVLADPLGYTGGTIQLFDNGDSAEAWFRFWGKGEYGLNDVLFVLEAHDLTGWRGTFPPEYDAGDTTMTTENGYALLRTANKRQEKDARSCLNGFPESAIVKVGISRLTP